MGVDVSKATILASAHIPCAGCGRAMMVTPQNTKRYYSGVVNFSETMCADCSKTTKGFYRVICVTCKAPILADSPKTTPKGFKLEAGKCYHTKSCPTCAPNSPASSVIEIENYHRENHIPSVQDQDLVKEIETKSLQGAAEAEKLKQSFGTLPP